MSFEKNIYAGADHAFLRQLSRRDGANRSAAEKAWPATISFLKNHLESD